MYIPKDNEELILKCKQSNFRGTFSIEEGAVLWHVTKHITLKIYLHAAYNEEGYIEEWYTDDEGKTFPQGHWHPIAENIFPDLQNINDNETAIRRKGIFSTGVIVDSKEKIAKLKNGIFVKYEAIEE